MKSSGQTRLPTADLVAAASPTEPIARTRSQPCLEQRPQVGGVVDPVWERVGARAVALHDRGAVRAAAAATPSPPGPIALLPRTTARRPISAILCRGMAAGNQGAGAWAAAARSARSPAS